MAIDRTALTDGIAPGWAPAEDLLPNQLDSAVAPVHAPWTAVARADRVAAGRALVARWRESGAAAPIVRIALPGGPGGTILWARLAEALGAIGIRAERVAWTDRDSDLRLIDTVAPYDSARWYLHTACQPCGEAATQAIDAARTAPTLAARASAIAQADAALAQDVAFVPIARPLRWSLVALRLRAWQPNDRAWHPLNRLRFDTNSRS
jgi:oligopeptide transport system substrate-binding protein